MAGAGTPRGNGLHGSARYAPQPSGRAGTRDLAGHQRAHGLLARRCGGGRRLIERAPSWLHRALRARARLPQGYAFAAAKTRRPYRDSHGTFQLPRLHRQRTGAGETVGAEGGLRLDRQTHQPAPPRRRFVVFLGELYTDLPLPTDTPVTDHCGTCQACIDICPTRAIVAPYELDARRCISYLTIESKTPIPVELRPLIGNRIFGCDDCQLVCPWNRFARPTAEPNFAPRHGVDAPELVELFGWSEDEFLKRTEGSAIRRAGYEGWLRNIAVALGNAPSSPREIMVALKARRDHSVCVGAGARSVGDLSATKHLSRAPCGRVSYLWVADPRQVTFLCLAKEKLPKERRTGWRDNPHAYAPLA